MNLRWPWTSVARVDDLRASYEARIGALRDEVEWLRAQNGQLAEHVRRIERREAGLTETPRQPREPIGKMPPELEEHLKGWDDPTLKREQFRIAWRRRTRGESWESIMADMTRTDEPQ